MGTKRCKIEKYSGVYYREVATLDGRGKERMYYIMYRRGGREAPLIEEPVGRASEGWTPARVNHERARRIAGGEQGQSNKERRQAAESKKRQGEPLTVERLWNLFSEEIADRPVLKKDDTGRIEYLKSIFSKRVAELQTSDMDALARRLSQTSSRRYPEQKLSAQSQKHVLGLLKRMLHFADRKGLCPYPQGLSIPMPKVDNQKTESMTAEQMAAYWQALDEDVDQVGVSILRIALLTGIRKTALLSLEWSDVDFEHGIIRLRGKSAKSGKTQFIPLNNAVKNVFASIERTNSPLVWPSPQTGERRANIDHIARRIRDRAGLPKDFRPMHGLRHAFASHLASSGKVDLYTLQKLLTHGSPLMTQRYAHLADEALKRAAHVAEDMVGSLGDEDKGE